MRCKFEKKIFRTSDLHKFKGEGNNCVRIIFVRPAVIRLDRISTGVGQKPASRAGSQYI